ncbi:CRISPR-associated endonuclease Cas2 [Ruegeria sediminis]|uniref:CRISPR-associated endoribonuclease Cas2 n=1 Tax=Ruegeria sediminis TaxID=2583820 RepID=A0ABY2WXF0_9RHOB|nr:CRISPR-associated endonuclease Cas2 [Ruegeria sediminis]TMV07539.1 CRISPR-associated endonuclease Cas2 [Ruegeria sediminis]
MLVLITYDVKTETSQGRKRLRRIARACQDFGQRVQYSVFECEVNPAQWTALRARLLSEYEESEDSLRFYFLGTNWKRRIEHCGARPATDFDDVLIV